MSTDAAETVSQPDYETRAYVLENCTYYIFQHCVDVLAKDMGCELLIRIVEKMDTWNEPGDKIILQLIVDWAREQGPFGRDDETDEMLFGSELKSLLDVGTRRRTLEDVQSDAVTN